MIDQLIRKTYRNLMKFKGYEGVCHECGSPVKTSEEFIAVEIENTEEHYLVVPIDIFLCPFCKKNIISLNIYKSLEVTQEFLHDA